MKEKEEFPEKELNEIEASNLWDIQYKVMGIKILKELNENYKEFSGDYISMKKDIDTMNKS